MGKVLDFLLIAGAAAMAAVVLAKFTHNELGLSPSLIREAALLCSGALGIGLYSGRLGGRK
jgi:hypothetical protein